MARRSIEMFNLSFLDLFSGALGAVIFLFIITPRGEGTSAASQPQIALSIDKMTNQVFGSLHDSLVDATVGDSFLVLITNFDEMPNEKDCPECLEVKDCPEVKKCPECLPCPKAIAEISRKNNNIKSEISLPKPSSKIVQPTSQPITNRTSAYKGDPPTVPCKVSFEISWADWKDNVDIYVCRGKSCVSGTKKRTRINKAIGTWDSGVSRNSGPFVSTDYRTNMEAVRQINEIIPGEYKIYAHFKESEKGSKSVQIKGLIYTKGKNGKEKGKRFVKTLIVNKKDGTELGTVRLKKDGFFTFIKK